MTRIIHRAVADHVRQAWKNGGGTTTELARHGDTGRWLWRLSIADVERSGPFSDFTGYRRIIVLLDGRGMALSFDGAPPVVLDDRYRSLAFDGAWRTDCTLLDGPIRDMNLIVDAARVDASLAVRTLESGTSFRVPASACALLHALDGHSHVTIGSRGITLARGDTLQVDDREASPITATALDAHATLAQITIGYRR